MGAVLVDVAIFIGGVVTGALVWSMLAVASGNGSD